MKIFKGRFGYKDHYDETWQEPEWHYVAIRARNIEFAKAKLDRYANKKASTDHPDHLILDSNIEELIIEKTTPLPEDFMEKFSRDGIYDYTEEVIFHRAQITKMLEEKSRTGLVTDVTSDLIKGRTAEEHSNGIEQK